MKFFTLVFILLTFSNNIFPQSIKGKIVNNDNYPLEYIKVHLQNEDSTQIKSELSDKDGYFIFKELSSGSYKLVVQYFSNDVYTQTLEVKSDMDLGIIVLNSEISLKEVVIGSKKKINKEMGKYVITNVSSSKFAKNKTIYDFLNTIPLIETSPDGLSLKIMNRGDAIILINGKNVGGNEIALNIIQSISATDIKKIEIIKKSDGRYDTNNKNGVINIILNDKENEGFNGNISTRNAQSFYNSQHIDSYFSYSKNKWNITSGAKYNNLKSKLKSDYIYGDFVNNKETSIRDNTTSINKNLTTYLNINYNLRNNQSIGFQLNSRFVNDNRFTTTNSIFRNINNMIIDSTNIATIENKSPNIHTVFTNVNYNIKTDSIGSNFEVSLNSYNNINNQNSYNNFSFSNRYPIVFLQSPMISTSVYNLKSDFLKIYNNDNKISIGASYTASKIDNNFFFGNFNGLRFISDSQQTNQFRYRDYTISGYLNYEKVINDRWECKLEFRVEHFESEGKTKENSNSNNISNTYIFPSFSVLYIPNDNHEFSLDLGSSILRPPYNNLNPFIRYTSPTSFMVSNLNLLPTISYGLNFNYTFFTDFSFDFEYFYDQNLFNDFDIVLPNGNIQTITDNWGNGSDYSFSLIYLKDFLKGKWNFSTSLNYNYNTNTGNYNRINLDYDNSSYNFRVKNNIILNKKQDLVLLLNYGYNSSNRSISGNTNALHSLVAEISKSFNNWNLSLGAYDIARSDLKIRERRTEYAFNKNIEYFRTYYINLRYSFGKKNVKKINSKDSIDRIEK